MEATEEQKKEMDALKEYYSKPEVQKVIGDLVVQFKEIFGHQWFTWEDLLKVFKTASGEQLVDIVRSLHLCGFLLVNDKKKDKKGEPLERFRLSQNAMSQSSNDSTPNIIT